MNRNELALDVNELTVSYGGLLAVSGASINVAPGEVVGLIGPNGANPLRGDVRWRDSSDHS